MSDQTIDFKDPLWMTAWLDMALDMEKDKLESCPVKRDLMPGAEVAQGWGFVVAGYFLVEQSFKALLHVLEKRVPLKHSLTMLYEKMDLEDQDLLREYYTDYKAAAGWPQFPFGTLDEFLANLDGDPNKQETDHVGSMDWRYFPIEESRSTNMPTVSIEFLHEITYGCIRMTEFAANGNFEPSEQTYSHRLRWKRLEKYTDWLTVRMNSGEWEDLPDRLEVYWGPDYKDRYDLRLFRGKGACDYFSEIPDDFCLPIKDKRREIDAFDVDAGFRSIGVSRPLGRSSTARC